MGASTASDGGDGAAPTPSPRAPRRRRRLNKSKIYDTDHGLVLEVHAGRARFHHQLRELHDGREAAVSGITISNNRRQIIDVLPTRKSSAVVVLQGLEELVDLLRDLCRTPSQNCLRSLQDA